MRDRVVVDIAGGGIGGAARWAVELDGFLAAARDPGAVKRPHRRDPMEVIGRRRPLTPGWLVRREARAVGARVAVAANSVAFGLGAGERRVVLRNALHFLHPHEEHLLAGMPRAFRAQIPVVRALLARADTIVVPSAAMADRVREAAPVARHRLVVRPHPVTPAGPRLAPVGPGDPFILVPVLPAPYKNLVPQLAALLGALDRTGQRVGVRVTAYASDLPGTLAQHPRLSVLGTVPHHALAELWQYAAAAFFPSIVEAFGYPLAEARVHGVPVLAPDTAQAREIAGPALVPYRAGDFASLTEAVQRLREPVPAEPDAFDRDAYFRWLCALPQARPLATARRSGGIAA